MERKLKNCASKNIQTVKRAKKFRNKRKINEFLKNNLKIEEDKHFRFHSLRNSLCNLMNNRETLIFTTELDNRNNYWNLRSNNSITNRYNIKKYHKSPLTNHRKEILNSVMDMCHDIYVLKNADNNNRMKLRETILKNVNNYLFYDLKKNILCPKIEKKKKMELILPNKLQKEKLLKSIDSNKINLKTIFQKYNNKPLYTAINLKHSKVVSYENYANNNTNYNHPQIYTLINNFKKYFPHKTQKNLKEFLDFSKLIPERKIDQKEINKQIYSVYKTMKNKNEIAFHI